jgi:uncharacterized membrane protein
MEWKNRLRNYGLWTSVASLVYLILRLFGVDVVEAEYKAVVDAIMAVLLAAGIVNNPATENRGYRDDV